ncbi:MAG: hypothetical protein ACC645_02445 [Pirellulales bacterium]
MNNTTIPFFRVGVTCLSVALLTAFSPLARGGEEVTFTFSGEVLTVDDSGGSIDGAISPGDSIEGSFTFESATADTEPGLSTLGKYDFAILDWDMDIGENSFSLSGFSSIVVQDDDVDRYEVAARLLAPFGDGVWNTFWTFADPDGNLFSSDALPLVEPNVLTLQTETSILFFDEAPAVVAVQLDQFGPHTRVEALAGDMDFNERVDFDDIDDFVLGLTDAEGYEDLYGVPPSLAGDTDGNGEFDFDDISGFVGLLSGSSAVAAEAQAVPEPGTAMLAVFAILFLFGTRLQGRPPTR